MITRSNMITTPGYVTCGAVAIRTKGNVTVDFLTETQDVSDTLLGNFDKVIVDRWVELNFTPLYRDKTNTDAIFFPWISLASTPPGTLVGGSSDTAWTVVGQDGTDVALIAGGVTKMPDINLGADKDIFGAMTVTGYPGTGDDPSSASSFFTLSTGNDFSYPAIPGTAYLGRSKWTAAYGANTGWTSLQAFDGFKITHDLKLGLKKDNGQRISHTLSGYRAMANFRPAGPTLSQLLGAGGAMGQIAFQGSGAAQGQRLSAVNQADLVITGVGNGSPVVTLKNIGFTSAKTNFDTEELRMGEVAAITGDPTSSGVPLASLVLA